MPSVSEALNTLVLVAIVALLIKVLQLSELKAFGYDFMSFVIATLGIAVIYALLVCIKGLVDVVKEIIGK